MPATPAWLASAEALLNRNLDATEAGSALLKRAEHSSLQLEVAGLTRIRAAVAGGRLMLLSGDDTPADATISGSAMALVNLARGNSQGAGAHGSRATARATGPRDTAGVQVHGDAEVASLYREIFALARPDWEEELSRWVGDIPARQFSRAAKQALSWVRGAGRSLGENISEYLTEESRDLVNSVEHGEFLRGVDRLRETADRVDARLARLEHRLRG